MVPNQRTGHSTFLVTASGKDALGITAELTAILSRHQAVVLDIGQALLHNLLSLSIIFETTETDPHGESIKEDLFEKARSLGLKLECQLLAPIAANSLAPRAYHYAVTLIADRISARALHEVASTLARFQVNIDSIKRLSENEFSCLEMIASSSLSLERSLDRSALKKTLLSVAREQGVDIALQAEGLYRRAKRLIVFDMDSTLIQCEVIDELARQRGVYDEVARITEEAMQGKLAFDESLQRRVAQLRGLSTHDLQEVFGRIQLTPGAEDLIRVLKKLGYQVALISGGFTFVAERLRERLNIDHAYANQLEIQEGRLTGKVIPPIVNAERKAQLLETIAREENIHPDQTIAIGDGANDLLMLEKAGLGIAFNAKPIVREKAAIAINHRNLRAVLYLLGISGRDVAEILQ